MQRQEQGGVCCAFSGAGGSESGVSKMDENRLLCRSPCAQNPPRSNARYLEAPVSKDGLQSHPYTCHTFEDVQGAVTKLPWSGQLLKCEPVAVAALFIYVLKLMMPHNSFCGWMQK